MRLRTDTIGHIEQPTELDIRSAISYPGEKASERDLVKLMIDDKNYLCAWIGKKEIGHTLEIITGTTKLACKEKFDSESAINLMIKYFYGDLDWTKRYSWEKSISQKFFENIQLLSRQINKPEPGH
jgi:hypothetical protein